MVAKGRDEIQVRTREVILKSVLKCGELFYQSFAFQSSVFNYIYISSFFFFQVALRIILYLAVGERSVWERN